MYNIVPPLLVIFGIVGLIFLLRNKYLIPEEEINQKHSILVTKWRKIWNRQRIAAVNEKIVKFFEKLLIRLRIIILRVDRLLSRGLERIRGQKEPINIRLKLSKVAKTSKLSPLIDKKISINTLEEQEKTLLITLLKEDFNLDSLINLARLYLYMQDFSSARWALIEAYRLDKGNKIIQDLLFELEEKESPPEITDVPA